MSDKSDMTITEFCTMLGFNLTPWQEEVIKRLESDAISPGVMSRKRMSRPFIGVDLAGASDMTAITKLVKGGKHTGHSVSAVFVDELVEAKVRAWFDLKSSLSRTMDDDADKYAFEPSVPKLDTSSLAYSVGETELDRIQANIEKVRAADRVRAELGPIGPMLKRAHELVHENLRKAAKRRGAETSHNEKD